MRKNRTQLKYFLLSLVVLGNVSVLFSQTVEKNESAQKNDSAAVKNRNVMLNAGDNSSPRQLDLG